MPKPAKTIPSYQELSRRVDEIMARIQDPTVGVDKAVRLFEQALEAIRQQENHLNKAETHILELKAKFGKGT